ncbi:MAG: hypothetical protein V4549_06425 [Bacteroidota bacterium]
MPDKKISALTSLSSLSDADVIPVVSSSITKKTILSTVYTYIASKLTGAISTTLTSNLTASKLVVSNGSGKLASSSYSESDLASAIPVYQKYVAVLNQSGTSAPVATILENTTGGTPTWSRLAVGSYSVNIGNASKTMVIVPTLNDAQDMQIGSGHYITGTAITTYNISTPAFEDDLLVDILIEIRLYP